MKDPATAGSGTLGMRPRSDQALKGRHSFQHCSSCVALSGLSSGSDSTQGSGGCAASALGYPVPRFQRFDLLVLLHAVGASIYWSCFVLSALRFIGPASCCWRFDLLVLLHAVGASIYWSCFMLSALIYWSCFMLSALRFIGPASCCRRADSSVLLRAVGAPIHRSAHHQFRCY